MTESILLSTKKVLGLAEDYTAFDPDILMHINSVFAKLAQLGAGPKTGFFVESADEEWGDFLGDDLRWNCVKSYVTTSVRMLFDPPTLGYLITAYEKVISEAEWRISVISDEILAETAVLTTTPAE